MLQEQLRHIAVLARLEPQAAVMERFGRQCADILNYIDILDEVDTTDVLPLYSPVEHDLAQRDDTPVTPPARSEVLANAPQTDGTFFIVPRIV